MLSLLGNSSTVSGSSDPDGTEARPIVRSSFFSVLTLLSIFALFFACVLHVSLPYFNIAVHKRKCSVDTLSRVSHFLWP